MNRRPLSEAVLSLRRVLHNPAIRRIELAWVAGTAADWAFLVALLVVAYDAGGAVAVGPPRRPRAGADQPHAHW